MSRRAHIKLRRAMAADLTAVVALLESALLPVADLDADHMPHFLLAEGKGLLGVVGLEGTGKARLLRSMAVAEHAQGQGLGHRLLQAIETQALAEGVESIFLLTTTAAPFFHRAGYVPVQRERAPAGLKLLAEFGNLCPTTASCMHKALA